MTKLVTEFNRKAQAIIFGLLMIVVATTAFADVSTNYQGNPALCPSTDAESFPGQNCTPQNICGYVTEIGQDYAQCYSTTALSPASSTYSSTSTTSKILSSVQGGYILDCNASADSAAPYCDNNGSYWCNPDSTCLTNHVVTQCVADTWATDADGDPESGAYSCATVSYNVDTYCISGYISCDAVNSDCEVRKNVTDYPTGANNHYGSTCLESAARCDTGRMDCDSSGVTAGNGCEASITPGGACTSGSLSGTWSCTATPGGSCTDGGTEYECTCSTATHFITGIQAIDSTTNPLLWGQQLGAGNIATLGNSASEDLFVINNSGNVGIGASVPLGQLDIFSADNTELYLRNISPTGFTRFRFTEDLVTNTQLAYDNAADVFTIETPSGRIDLKTGIRPRLTVLDSGYVGIGTTSPTNTLTIASVTDSATLGNEETDTFNWTSTDWTGNYDVGFTHTTGNSTPLSRTMTNTTGELYEISFTVSDNTHPTASVTVTLGGVSSGYFGANGTFTFGPKVISDNGSLIFTPLSTFDGTISDISVKQITGTVAAAQVYLDENGNISSEVRTSEQSLNNTWMGLNSGSYSTTGYDNVGNGAYSLYSNTTGHNNTAVGSKSMYTNITGRRNSSMGYESLYNNTTGNDNNAFGYRAMYSNLTGYNNVAVGNQALYSILSGVQNTAVGMDALYSRTTGGQNTALGVRALYAGTSGSLNVAIGEDSLYTNNGSSNVAVGNAAGRQNTGSGNVFLGYNAGYYESGSDRLYIDNSNTAAPLIWGDFNNNKLGFNGNVGIGNTSPQSELHVSTSTSTGMRGITLGTGVVGGSTYNRIMSWDYAGLQLAATDYNASSPFAAIDLRYDGNIYFRSEYSGNPPLIRMNINQSDGNVGIGIGSSTPGYKLQVGMPGDGTEARANAWNTLSDERFKDDIKSIVDASDVVTQLRGVTYKWKSNEKESSGFIAQEVEEVLPIVVSEDPQGIKSIEYSRIIPYIVEAVKENTKDIDKLAQSSGGITDDILGEMTSIYEQMVDATQALGLSSEEGTLLVQSDMSVAGSTTLSEVTISGDVTVGMIQIQPTTNSISTLGGACYNEATGELNEELCENQALYIQPDSTGNVSLFGDRILLSPDGSIKAKAIEAKTGKFEEVLIKTESDIVGQATIAPGTDNVKVETDKVTDTSKIFITPLDDTGGRMLYIKEKSEGEYFIVSTGINLENEVKFDWWIVNTEE